MGFYGTCVSRSVHGNFFSLLLTQCSRKLPTSSVRYLVFACDGIWINYYNNWYWKSIDIVRAPLYQVINLSQELQRCSKIICNYLFTSISDVSLINNNLMILLLFHLCSQTIHIPRCIAATKSISLEL